MVLLLLTPLLWSWPTSVWLAYLALPTYMLHQYEEHDRDQFRIFINALVGPERRGLTQADVLFINTAGVWIPIAFATLGAAYASSRWALLVAYLLLVNAVAHIGQLMMLQKYNPGSLTAAFLFLPLGGVLLAVTPGGLAAHLLSLGSVLILHALIVVRAVSPVRA